MDSPAFKLSIIFTLIASCVSDRCWWQAESFCQNRTCDEGHYMWRGYDARSEQSVQFFCPKSEGHDVVLCEHPNYTGECYATHIPKGKDCANVESVITNSAGSVYTLGGCIRLYDEADCRGGMVVARDSNANLTEMNDMVSSVGLCTEEDHPKGGCNQASPEGRLECMKDRCYWSGRPNCGDSRTCGEDHFMWEGLHEPACGNDSTVFCCPKSEGHDVVVCEDYDLKGDCIVTHIPKGQSCAHVEINDWASSVHSLGECIALYQDANCEKLMMIILEESTVGHNFRPEMNDILTSVGLCPPDDQPENGSGRGTPDRRSLFVILFFCSFFFVLILGFFYRKRETLRYKACRLISQS